MSDLDEIARAASTRPQRTRRRQATNGAQILGKIAALLVLVGIILAVGLNGDDGRESMIQLLTIGGVVAVLIWAISFAIRSSRGR